MSTPEVPPSPDGLPLLGNGLAFSRDPFGALEQWATLGDVVRLSMPGQELFVVTEPDLVREVLVERSDAVTISAQQREVFRDVEDDALAGTAGDQWRRLRNALSPAFTADRIEAHGRPIAAATANFVDRWNGHLPDFHREMRHLTVHVLGETLLGVDMAGDESVVLEAADALVARSDPRRPGQFLPSWVPTPTERRFQRVTAALEEYVEDVLASDSRDGDDVRSVLLAARDRGDLSTAELTDNLVGIMLAGHDSSAVALTYAWYELSRNPEVRARLRDEVEATCGEDLPEASDAESLAWTRAVVDETLRLYPPVWATPRETKRALCLGGYEIPAGRQVLCPQWVLHRDDRFWDRPEAFDPQRWGREESRPEYAYFPFSGGPRHCIGMRFARLELTLAVATMAQRVSLDVSADGPLSFEPALTLRPTVTFDATATPR